MEEDISIIKIPGMLFFIKIKNNPLILLLRNYNITPIPLLKMCLKTGPKESKKKCALLID